MIQPPTKTLEAHICGFLMRKYGTRVEADVVALSASLATMLQPAPHQTQTWEAVWKQFDERAHRSNPSQGAVTP